MAAHAKDPAATWHHYAEAQAAARQIGADRDDSAAALSRAEHVTLTDRTPPERAGHHYIDLARAQLLHGQREQALNALQQARAITPQQVRYHRLARDVVLTLAQGERRSCSTLRGMARWMGLET